MSTSWATNEHWNWQSYYNASREWKGEHIWRGFEPATLTTRPRWAQKFVSYIYVLLVWTDALKCIYVCSWFLCETQNLINYQSCFIHERFFYSVSWGSGCLERGLILWQSFWFVGPYLCGETYYFLHCNCWGVIRVAVNHSAWMVDVRMLSTGWLPSCHLVILP